jgi:hypothetical protein
MLHADNGIGKGRGCQGETLVSPERGFGQYFFSKKYI